MTVHLEFGKELKRDFEVHENCYDCADFYDGCEGWRASKDFGCQDFNRLPDVLPGTCGQTFPPSRMNGRKEPRMRPAPSAPVQAQVEPKNPATHRRAPTKPEPIEQQPAASSRQPTPELDPATPPALEVPREDSPTSQPGQPGEPGGRTCGCGAALPKGKRLCGGCRTQNRRQTKRDYMRTYMEQRRSAGSCSDSHVPFPAAVTPSTQASGDDPHARGQREGGASLDQTSVLTESVL